MKARRFGLWLRLLVGGALLLAIWVLAVWVAARPAFKRLLDLTPQQVNSVDPATEELLRELRAKGASIEFHLLYPPSSGQPENNVQAQLLRIRDRLRELTRLLLVRYQFLGAESVTLVQHDFYGDPRRTREAAQRFGYSAAEDDVVVVAVTMPGKEARFRKLALGSDLALIERPDTGATPTQAMVLPVMKRFLGEEQISSAIKSLLLEGTPVVYLLKEVSPLVFLGDGAGHGYGRFLDALARSGFEVREWKTTVSSTVPPDAALVVVLEPTHEFSDRTADALHEYVRRGGRVFLNYAWSPIPDSNPDGGRFAQLLGYGLSARPVFHGIRDSARTGGRVLADDMAVSKLQLELNPLHPATRRLVQRPMELDLARQVGQRNDAPAGVRRETLMRTGTDGWLAWLGPDGHPSYQKPNITLQAFDVGMAIEVDVAPDAATGPDARKTGSVVVVGGIFCNNLGMPLFGDLALNICNWLAERRVLLDLKTLGYEAKYLKAGPPELQRVRWLLVWGAPGAFLVAGLVVLWLRRRS